MPLIVASSALVLPSEEQLRDLEIRDNDCLNGIISESRDFFEHWKGAAEEAFHQAYDTASDEVEALNEKFSEKTADIHSWLSSHSNDIYEDLHVDRPHHGDDPHHEPNQTVYQLIAGSKYTTKLAELINEFPDLVKALNGTKANFTIFAPTDAAFAKIPEDEPKPSKEVLKKILSYHVSDSFYPAGRVLVTHTIPTLLVGDELAEGLLLIVSAARSARLNIVLPAGRRRILGGVGNE